MRLYRNLKCLKTMFCLTYLLRLCSFRIKEEPLTKNSPIDFAQNWAIHMKKFN